MYALSSVTKGQRQRVQDMLKNPDFCPNWNKVRSASLVFVDDKLQANSVLTLLCEQAEPIIHDFQVLQLHIALNFKSNNKFIC